MWGILIINPIMYRESLQPYTLGKVAFWLLLLCLTSYVIESPLKFALGKIGLSFIIYGRDAFALAVIFLAFISWGNGKNYTIAIPVTGIIIFHMFYGMIIQGSLIQPLVGFKLYITLILGVATWETFKNEQLMFKRWYIAMYVLTVIGVIINSFTDMPWAGETFDSAVGATEVSREWTTGGIRRLAGFAKASFDASTIAVVLGAAIALMPGTSNWIRLLLLGLTAWTVVLTTSKGSMLALMAITLYIAVHEKDKPRFNTLLFAAPALMLGIPLLLYITGFKATVNGNLWFLLSSFAERINWMWPRAFENLESVTNIFLGRGIGGIGFPQRFGEATTYNSADNVTVYLFVSMGLASVFYIYKVLINLRINKELITPYIWHCLICWILYWIFYGFTTNLIENPFFTYFTGLIIGAALQRRQANTHE